MRYDKDMDIETPITTCPRCHAPVRPTDYYCYNCGKKLRMTPPSLRIESLVTLFLVSIFLPPLGILMGWPYLREKDWTRRIIGTAAVLANILATFVAIKLAADVYFSTLNAARSLQNLSTP